MKDREQKHFDRISEKYHKASDSWKIIYEQIEKRINPLITDKVVLDVGNGGLFAYDLARPSQILVMDVSANQLSSICDTRITKIVSDAREMRTIENGSVDVIIFVMVLHHISGNSFCESIETLEGILSEARSKLRPGGHLVVAEALLSPVLFRVQKLCFQLTRSILHRFGVSMVFFCTQTILAERIAKVFEIELQEIETTDLNLKGWVDPLGGCFPGLIKIPASMHPWDFKLMIASLRLGIES